MVAYKAGITSPTRSNETSQQSELSLTPMIPFLGRVPFCDEHVTPLEGREWSHLALSVGSMRLSSYSGVKETAGLLNALTSRTEATRYKCAAVDTTALLTAIESAVRMRYDARYSSTHESSGTASPFYLDRITNVVARVVTGESPHPILENTPAGVAVNSAAILAIAGEYDLFGIGTDTYHLGEDAPPVEDPEVDLQNAPQKKPRLIRIINKMKANRLAIK